MQKYAEQCTHAVTSNKTPLDGERMRLGGQPAKLEELRVAELRSTKYAGRDAGQIAEMLQQADSKARFSWLLLGRGPLNSNELLLTWAGVLALSTSTSASHVPRMVPGRSPDAVRQISRRLVDDRKLRLASDVAFGYLLRLEIAQHRGPRDLASSDMRSPQTPQANWQAHAAPQRNTTSIRIDTHSLDRWGMFYT